MPRVSLQGNPTGLGNPYIADVGKSDSDAVIIYSNQPTPSAGGYVIYQIRRKDNSPLDGINSSNFIDVASNQGTSELIKEVNNISLKIILPLRTEFEVRTRRAGFSWSTWTSFKTRDKTYALPDSSTELRVTETATGNGARIVVTNYGKTTVTETRTGATVVNNDQGDNESMNNNFYLGGGNSTGRGRYIKTKTYIETTSTGAKVSKHS